MSRASTSKSSSASGTPRRPAMASRWITAFVDPPIAALTRIAFSNAALVMMAEGRRSSRTRPTMTWPARCAVSYRRASTPGQVAEYGSCLPSAPALDAMVDAVPNVMPCPLAQRHGRELQREPARLPDPALDRLGHPVQVDVARRQFGPGGRDADDRPAVEDLRGEALAAHPAPVGHARPAGRAEPLAAAEGP